jgi:hypothetical protein
VDLLGRAPPPLAGNEAPFLRSWNETLDATLKKMGFEQSQHEAVVCRQGQNGCPAGGCLR